MGDEAQAYRAGHHQHDVPAAGQILFKDDDGEHDACQATGTKPRTASSSYMLSRSLLIPISGLPPQLSPFP